MGRGAGGLGSVASIWRYLVKSMLGEELEASEVTDRGLFGDRAAALVDQETEQVASAKNPRKWAGLLECRARFVRPPIAGQALPAVRVVLPDGTEITSEEPIDVTLSSYVGRPVRLRWAGEDEGTLEEYWPDIEGLDHRDAVTVETMPPRTFFDGAVVHLLTTASLGRLTELYPEGRFDLRRFRPNIVVQPASPERGFVEGGWVGRRVALGDRVRLRIDRPCSRCVMTTLPQSDLPRDLGILRTVARHNRVHAGVYASVERGGTVHRGDAVELLGDPLPGRGNSPPPWWV